jgi:hypothetical protein
MMIVGLALLIAWLAWLAILESAALALVCAHKRVDSSAFKAICRRCEMPVPRFYVGELGRAGWASTDALAVSVHCLGQGCIIIDERAFYTQTYSELELLVVHELGHLRYWHPRLKWWFLAFGGKWLLPGAWRRLEQFCEDQADEFAELHVDSFLQVRELRASIHQPGDQP